MAKKKESIIDPHLISCIISGCLALLCIWVGISKLGAGSLSHLGWSLLDFTFGFLFFLLIFLPKKTMEVHLSKFLTLGSLFIVIYLIFGINTLVPLSTLGLILSVGLMGALTALSFFPKEKGNS